MASLANQGLKISKNIFFSSLVKKAIKLFGKPAKVAFVLREAYQKLIDAKSNKSGFVQIREVMMSFIRLVKAYFQGDYRDIATKSVIIGLATLLYVVTPLDLVPDFIPVLGFADDISIMAWFVRAFQTELTKFREWEQAQGIMPT